MRRVLLRPLRSAMPWMGFFVLVTLGSARGQTPVLGSQRALVVYHDLASSTMKEAYGSAYGATWQFTAWAEEGYPGEKFGVQGEVGLIGADGDPIMTSDAWTVNSSSLGMVVVPIGLAGLYRLSGDESGSFSSYIGLGLMGFLGAERLAVEVSRSFWGEYDWHDGVFRASIAGQAFLGAHGRVSGRFSWAAEVSWLQCGRGSTSGGGFTEEEIEQGWGEVAEAFQHPDFSFTGLRAGVGVQW